ncbi:ABC transporter permease subunit [Methylonatrum kenyense]|uniref:ABC transporter permease subunit n=1 Tax=Methylonatrum kenyense TaxID=455253 RepID=UPI0020BF0942|nr:ABC transporter permease subunit [Methylonatrum kenyense]MCK8517092.1 ABC transporter permease subunit [Methylonatrum kenyense]
MNDLSSRPEAGSGSVRSLLPSGDARKRLRRWRAVKDVAAKVLVAVFGVGVIGALALIFIYLFSEVFPLLESASTELQSSYEAPGGADVETVHVASNRHRSLAVRFTDDRRAVFFNPLDGEVSDTFEVPLGEGTQVTARAQAEPRTRISAYGLDSGEVLIVEHVFDEEFRDGERRVSGRIKFPMETEEGQLLDIAGDGTPVRNLAIQRGSGGIMLAVELADDRLILVNFAETTSFMTGETTVEVKRFDLTPPENADVTRMLIDITGRVLLLGDEAGQVHYYNIARPADAQLVDVTRVIDGDDAAVTAMEYLLGSESLIVGGSDGSVSQWFLVRDADNVRRLTRVRGFDGHDAPIRTIAPEYGRKGFATADEAGGLKLHFSTSEQTLLSTRIGDGGSIRTLAFAPRANALFAVDDNERLHALDVRNAHPEMSLSALWNRVWYEGRSEPEFVWQSSSATDEFEPKFSLVPLTVGTLKAAFYAMLFATPIAIMGAIYSAYFMSPRMRSSVKPTIEIMEALPTVILGFLAGLWLAPFVEANLPSVFTILLFTPLAMLVFAWLWSVHIGPLARRLVPDGWEAALLVPVVILTVWACVATSPLIEIWFFNGDMRQWLTDVGITYDQRNALVVGIAMGFAVIPTIYSISEDAVFNVPKHLTQGSLALGATPWQTMVKVVLLTASPGIFSAVMIGFGRAVGETMIVLMATGNSPVVNFNIFEGMRTLSANIAVEMGETAVGGTHYRILFLAALVLFVLTFVVNTAAELVRQRLRRKYSSL